MKSITFPVGIGFETGVFRPIEVGRFSHLSFAFTAFGKAPEVASEPELLPSDPPQPAAASAATAVSAQSAIAARRRAEAG
jgi:hypothetical protein